MVTGSHDSLNHYYSTLKKSNRLAITNDLIFPPNLIGVFRASLKPNLGSFLDLVVWDFLGNGKVGPPGLCYAQKAQWAHHCSLLQEQR